MKTIQDISQAVYGKAEDILEGMGYSLPDRIYVKSPQTDKLILTKEEEDLAGSVVMPSYSLWQIVTNPQGKILNSIKEVLGKKLFLAYQDLYLLTLLDTFPYVDPRIQPYLSAKGDLKKAVLGYLKFSSSSLVNKIMVYENFEDNIPFDIKTTEYMVDSWYQVSESFASSLLAVGGFSFELHGSYFWARTNASPIEDDPIWQVITL